MPAKTLTLSSSPPDIVARHHRQLVTTEARAEARAPLVVVMMGPMQATAKRATLAAKPAT